MLTVFVVLINGKVKEISDDKEYLLMDVLAQSIKKEIVLATQIHVKQHRLAKYLADFLARVQRSVRVLEDHLNRATEQFGFPVAQITNRFAIDFKLSGTGLFNQG